MILTAEYESLMSAISSEGDNPEELNRLASKMHEFLKSVKEQIMTVFLYSNKGNQIKELFTTDETKTVSTLDFSYGYDQYLEYFSGMKRYIEESKQRNFTEDEINKKVLEIMEKDISFIKSIFVRGENIHNKEITIPACQAIGCSNVLLLLKEFIEDTQIYFVRNILDKLMIQSISSMAYYVLNGVINEIDEISNQLNSTGSDPTPVTEYKVF